MLGGGIRGWGFGWWGEEGGRWGRGVTRKDRRKGGTCAEFVGVVGGDWVVGSCLGL